MQSSAQKIDAGTGPGKAAFQLDDFVDSALRDLEQAARGDFAAWALSSAMSTISTHYCDKSTGPISPAQRDELLLAIVRAQLGANKHLPQSYSRDQIAAGMQALAGQAMIWAENLVQTSKRRQHALADLDAYARMFRNDLHNMSLSEEIERRAWERHAAEVQDFLGSNDGSEAVGA